MDTTNAPSPPIIEAKVVQQGGRDLIGEADALIGQSIYLAISSQGHSGFIYCHLHSKSELVDGIRFRAHINSAGAIVFRAAAVTNVIYRDKIVEVHVA